MHFVHEGELAHGKAVGKADVGDCDEALCEGEALLWPCRPVDSGQPAWCLGALDTSGNDGDTDGEDDGGEVNVAEDGNLGETRWDGNDHKNDGGDNGEDDGADAAAGDVLEGNGTREAVRANQEEELQDEHGVDDLVAPAATHQSSGIRVIGDLRKVDLDLAHDVGGIDGNQANADRTDDTGDHSQRGKCSWDGQTSQRDGLDDEDNRQAFPAKTVVFLHTLLIDIPLPLALAGIAIEALVLVEDLPARGTWRRRLSRAFLHDLRGVHCEYEYVLKEGDKGGGA